MIKTCSCWYSAILLSHEMSAESVIYLDEKGPKDKARKGYHESSIRSLKPFATRNLLNCHSIVMFAYFVAVFLNNTTSFAVYTRTIFVDISVTSYDNKLKVDMQIQLPNCSNQMNILKATTCSNVQRTINSICFLA